MQRRNASGAAPGPALRHPVPRAPVRAEALNSPPLETASLSSPSSGPSSSKPRSQVSTGPGEYQRFSSPPVPNNAVPAYQHLPDQSFGNAQAFGNSQQPYGNFASAQPGLQGGGYPQSQVPPQQQAPWPGMAGPAYFNDATAQMGMQFGKSAVAAGSQYVEQNFSRFVPVGHLQHSFNVSNMYVLSKLKIVLFPWRHRPWSRLVKRSEASGQAEGYKPPREDINSPDLYIPTMALVTYILLSGMVAGFEGRFHPELLGVAASKSMGIVFVEFLIIKLGCYLLNIGGEGTVTDLLAYSGYKFVGIVVCLLSALLGTRGWSYSAVFVYVFCANALFLLRSLRYVVLPDPALAAVYSSTSNANPPSHSAKRHRMWFLFGIAASQVASMFMLSRV